MEDFYPLQTISDFGIKDPTMRQRSRFSKTFLCLLLRVTPDDGKSALAAAVPYVVGIKPPPPSLRTLQSADDKPPRQHNNFNLNKYCTTTIIHQVRLTCIKKYDQVRHPAPFCFFLYDCKHIISGTVQSIMAIL